MHQQCRRLDTVTRAHSIHSHSQDHGEPAGSAQGDPETGETYFPGHKVHRADLCRRFLNSVFSSSEETPI